MRGRTSTWSSASCGRTGRCGGWTTRGGRSSTRRTGGGWVGGLDDRGRPFFARGDGGRAYMTGAGVDVRGWRAGWDARGESAARLRQRADAMPQIVWMPDAGGEVVYFNRRWEEYT